MIIQKSMLKGEEKVALRDGPGKLIMTDLTAGKGTCKNCRLIVEFQIPPGAGIGPHVHDKETEYYIMLEGTAVVNDNGKDVTVNAGDVVITGDGAGHSITNKGNTTVKMIAVIITYN